MYILRFLRVKKIDIINYKITKRSVDARNRSAIKLVYTVEVNVKSEDYLLNKLKNNPRVSKSIDRKYNFVAKAQNLSSSSENYRPVIIGAGPCGYFAALLLAQMGFKPLLLERGKSVRERSINTYAFWSGKTTLNLDSNVQFGEGGAGTFSDGKLYSQISDPSDYRKKVLEELVESGANPEILIDNKPHIGTFKLARVVRGFRLRIEQLGGEIRFNSKMEELVLETSTNGKKYKVKGLKLSDGSFIRTNYLIIALGHSARESFKMLDKIGVYLQQKLFSVGFRIEHEQLKVDEDRWGEMCGHPQLGAAEYKLVHHSLNGRNVYSFCMCPGGQVVGASSNNECVVTNGMSQHTRNMKNANSAIVVNLEKEDLLPFERFKNDPLAGLFFQEYLEKKAFELGGSNYYAPVQRLEDFMSSKTSIKFGLVKPSYLPGVKFADLNFALPRPFIEAIREAFVAFSKKNTFFKNPDAILTGLETRTSSPVRISRDKDLESLNVQGLFPAGEGAGYAGGIMSAGIDGIKVAEIVAKKLSIKKIN